MKRHFALLLGLCLLALACGAEPTPAPDLVATQVAVEKAAAATLTAEMPTATNTPMATLAPIPSATSTNTHTPMPTWTPPATWTPTPTLTNAPTEVPTSSPPLKPTKKPKPMPTGTRIPELVITYENFHYECQKREWHLSDGTPVWGYRRFQTLMIIKNNSTKVVEAPWWPTRWIIANYRHPQEQRVMYGAWEWVDPNRNFYPEPSIAPGGKARWTYMAFPLERWEYAKAVEFDRWGQTYHFELPRPKYAGEYNMWDCGDYPDPQKPSWRDAADWTVPTP